MKKIVWGIVVVQLLILMIGSVPAFQGDMMNALLYRDGRQVLLDFSQLDNSQAQQLLLNEAEKNSVNIKKMVVPSLEALIIYTNEDQLAQDAKLTNGRLPQTKGEFVADYETGSDQQVGTIERIDQNKSIIIYDFSQLPVSQISGSYIATGEPAAVSAFLNTLADEAVNVETIRMYQGVPIQPGIDNLYLLGSILFLYLISCFTFVQYFIRYQKKFTVQQAHGWSKSRIGYQQIGVYFNVIASSSLFAMLLGGSYYALQFGISSYFYRWLSLFMAVAIGNGIIMLSLMSILLKINIKKKVTVKKINGRKNYRLLLFTQYAMKCLFAIMIFGSLLATAKSMQETQSMQAQMQVWEQAENLYHPNFAKTISSNDEQRYKKEYARNQQLQQLQTTIEVPNFIIDASNFTFVGDIVGYEYYSHQPNKPHLDPENGKKITADTNYLAQQQVADKQGNQVADQIDQNSKVMTILVPEALESELEVIKQAYQEKFYFQEVELVNSFLEDFGESVRADDFIAAEVQAIVVPNQTSYFTYQLKNAQVIDPIVEVYKPRQNLMNMQQVLQNWYLELPTGGEYETLAPLLSQLQLQSVIPSVTSVYDQVGAYTQELVTTQFSLILTIGLLLVMNLLMSYHFCQSYYEKYRYRFAIQTLFGYSFWRKNWQIIAVLISIGCLSGISIRLLLHGHAVVGVGVVTLIGIDLIMMVGVQRHLLQTRAIQLLKRGQ
ncbi:MAG: DUF1430 domain-containing protein [Culicoidibacterales bacterium]